MSNFWNIWIIVLVFANIIGIMWLLFATNKKTQNDKDGKVDDTGHEWDGIKELDTPMPRWWLWLFVGTTIFGVIYAFLYPTLGSYEGTLGWTQTKQHEEALAANRKQQEKVFAEYRKDTLPELAKNHKAMQTAGRLFGNNCALCHGSDAQGAPGFPDLTDADWLYGNSPEHIMTSIKNGRAGAMPAMGAALGEQGVYEVSQYIKSLSRKTVDKIAVEAGRQRFAMTCAACHGADAKGNTALGAPDLSDDIWLHGRDLASIQSVIREGRVGNMPSHSDLLSEDQIRLLTAYVLSVSEQ